MSGTVPRVALVGTGRMGRALAGRLAGHGLLVAVWNRTSGPARALADRTGVAWAATPAEAATQADVVLTVLSDGPALLEVLTGPEGVLAGLAPGGTVVDCSTTGAPAARRASGACAQAGIGFVDAPVSGNPSVAERGALGVMAGGPAELLRRVRPVLDSFGADVVHVGPAGSGAAAKVAVNGLLHAFSTALAETLVAARADGVADDRLLDALGAGVLANAYLGYKREAFLHPRTAAVTFDLATATKDLRLSAEASERAGLTASLVRGALALHERALADGYGEQDIAAMAAWFDDRTSPTPTKTRT